MTFFQTYIYPQAIGEIRGKVSGHRRGYPLRNIDIKLTNTKYNTKSNIDGDFILENIPIGCYQIEFNGFPYKKKFINNVEVELGKISKVETWLKVDTSKTHGILDTATVFFSFSPSKNKKLNKNDIIIEYKDGQFEYLITGNNFFIDKHFAQQHTVEYETSKENYFYSSIICKRMEELIAKGSINLPLKNDWCWHIQIYIGSENPYLYCFGCQGYKSFPIHDKYKSSPIDSMYIIWGGNTITFPRLY